MKKYYILGGDAYVSDDMSLATLVVEVPANERGSYIADGAAMSRPVITVNDAFKKGLRVESIPRKQLIQMSKKANCVHGVTKLLKGTSAEFKRALEQTRSAETFVIVGEVYGQKGELYSTTYSIQDRVGYEIVLIRNVNGARVLQVAYKSLAGFAEWDRSNPNRFCANASVDRSGVNATIRFRDAYHLGVAMLFGTFKAPVQKVEEQVQETETVQVEESAATISSQPYTKEQLEEIRVGKEKGVNTAVYENPDIPAKRMKRIRHFLERGYKVEPLAPFATRTMSDEVFDLYCRLCQTGDISQYVYDRIDVGAVYTLYLEFTGDAPDTGWLDRAKQKAGAEGTVTLELLDSVGR